MTATPNKTQRQCVWWEVSIMTFLVFLAVYSVVAHVFDQSPSVELLMSMIATCSVLWSIWVIRTFRNIMNWWIDIQHRVSVAVSLLEETKQDVKDIKTLAKPANNVNT